MIALGWLVAFGSWIAVVPLDDRDPPPSPATLLGTGKLETAHAKHIQGLIKQFQDPDATRRHQAIAAVVRIGDAAVPLLRDRIDETSNPLVQRAALIALAEIGGSAAAATLQRLVRGDTLRDEELAVAILGYGAVAPTVDPIMVARLVELGSARKPNFARRAAALALGRLRASEGLAACLDGQDRDVLDDHRVALLTAAAACADVRFTGWVLTGLEDRSDPVRRAACLALAESGDTSGEERLIKLARSDRSPPVILTAILALGRGSDARSLEFLVDTTQSADEAVRLAAWSAIAARNDGAPRVAAALTKPVESTVLVHLAYASSESAAATLSQPLQGLLAHSRAEVRSAAGCALALRGDRGAEAPVVKWLKDERDPAAHATALLVIGALRLEAAGGILSETKVSAERDLTHDVLRTLGGRRDPHLMHEALLEQVVARRARELDLRTQVFAELTHFVFHLDTLDRSKVVAGKPGGNTDPGGGDDGGEGGGSGGSPGGNDGTFGGLLGKGKVDRKSSVVERDLEMWFERAPYFQARAPNR